MSHEAALARYSQEMLGGRPVPADLRTLLILQWERDTAADAEGADPLATMWTHLFDSGETNTLLDHSYLDEKDRADPDIMANVAAMTSTCAFAAFVARDDDGNLFGYWFGPENTPIESAAILRLDTEGAFEIIAGSSLSEALVGDRVFDDDAEFAKLKGQFGRVGISFSANCWEDLVLPETASDPGIHHEKLYNENRAKAGLPPYR
jgi:hypothetical protein